MSDDKPKDGLKSADSQAEKKPTAAAAQPAADTKPPEAKAAPPAAAEPAAPAAEKKPVEAKAAEPATEKKPVEAKTAPPAAAEPAAPAAEKKPVEAKAAEPAAEKKPVEAKAALPAVAEPAPPAAEKKPVSNIALVVDDEPANRDFLMRLLEQTGLEVKGASDGKEALDIANKTESVALLAIDHKLPDMDGVDLIHKLREKYPHACVVMATMLDERALMAQAFENGCNVFLVKPHGFMELFKRLQETGPDPEQFDHLIIDQYGLRPYRG